MTYKCTKCQHTFNKQYEFCPYCGTILSYKDKTVSEKKKTSQITLKADILTCIGFGLVLLTFFLTAAFGFTASILKLNNLVDASKAFYDAIEYVYYILPIPAFVISIMAEASKGRKPFTIIGIVLGAFLVIISLVLLSIALSSI